MSDVRTICLGGVALVVAVPKIFVRRASAGPAPELDARFLDLLNAVRVKKPVLAVIPAGVVAEIVGVHIAQNLGGVDLHIHLGAVGKTPGHSRGVKGQSRLCIKGGHRAVGRGPKLERFKPRGLGVRERRGQR